MRHILLILVLAAAANAALLLADAAKANSAKEAESGEAAAVKAVLDARRAYQDSLHKLHEHYKINGDMEKTRWVEEELKGYHLILKPAYRLDDVPGAKLDGKENIKDANELFRAAMQYKDRGFGTDYTLNQRRAEILLNEVIAKHPTSDKISDSAYELGDLYESRAYRQYARAALFYERSAQWRKTGRTDARLRAAKLYDRQLGDRNKAIELYREVILHDTDPERVKEAERRMAELTGTRK
jgi:hypothetical protein